MRRRSFRRGRRAFGSRRRVRSSRFYRMSRGGVRL